ncbi:MAG: phosphonate ABC transporter, permease protein PhnE, partial [Hyphomicrobiaceae bacterium]
MSAPAADTGPLAADPGSALGRAFPANWPMRIAAAIFLVYVVYAAQTLDLRLERFIQGLGNGAKFLGR